MTLFRTVVERAGCGVRRLLRTGGVPTSLTFILLLVAGGLFVGLYGPERLGRVTHRYRTLKSFPNYVTDTMSHLVFSGS